MGIHRSIINEPGARDRQVGDRIALSETEARHARRVKRLADGDPIELLDGAGWRATAELEGQGAILVAFSIEPTPDPAIEIACPAPKGDRLAQMIDQLSQCGAAAWRPLQTERSVVEPRQNKLDRLHRIADEAMKQCGRAHRLEILEPLALADLLARPHERRLLADAGGDAAPTELSGQVQVLLGPEGGLTDAELDACRDAGAVPTHLGPHVMRIETAAVAAAVRLRA
ncbi:MAG: RsmE family RNA methyltransferase [Planctomycetota bacterium]